MDLPSNIDKVTFPDPKLDAQMVIYTCRIWIIRMKFYLQQLDLQRFIELDRSQIESGFETGDRKARHVIISHLGEDTVFKVYKSRSAKEMWDMLMSEYQQACVKYPRGSDVTVPK
jgi:hypothetical protein